MRLIVVYILRVQQHKVVTIVRYKTARLCNGKCQLIGIRSAYSTPFMRCCNIESTPPEHRGNQYINVFVQIQSSKYARCHGPKRFRTEGSISSGGTRLRSIYSLISAMLS